MTTMKTLRARFAAILIALAVAFGIAVVPATAAQAVQGSTVTIAPGSNTILVRNMAGKYFTPGHGSTIYNVQSVWIPANSCIAISIIQCAPKANGIWVRLLHAKTYELSTNWA